MAIRDYWVYQRRQNDGSQWALYIVKEFERGKPESTALDITYYSEGIRNETNSKSTIGIHHDTVAGYVDEIIAGIEGFSTVEDEDRNQLEIELLRILCS